MKRLLNSLRARFVAGLLVAVPVIATFLAIRFLFLQVDGLFAHGVAEIVGRRVPGLGLVVTLLIVFGAGVVATNVLGRRVITWTERVLIELPFVRTIYRASKEILHAATLSHRQVFRDVVMIEYPRRGVFSYGFVTSYTTRHESGNSLRLANVFIPGPPVPTTGVLIAIPIEDLFYLDVSVEDALKLILSGGMAAPRDLRRQPRPADAPVPNRPAEEGA